MRAVYTANPGAAETFRWAFGTSPKGVGLSPQTEPRQFRFRYIPPPGKIFVNPDLDQVEARYVAYRSNCRNMIEVFETPGRHIHKETGEWMYGFQPQKGTNEYDKAKQGVHSTDYKEGPFMLALSAGIPFPEARRIIEVIYDRRPELLEWHEEVKRTIRTTGRLVNCWGEERQFYEAVAFARRWGTITDQQWKDGIAWEPQSIPPHIVNDAIWKIWSEGPEYVWFHQHMHDSFLASVPIDKLQEFADFAIPLLNVTLNVNGRGCRIPAAMDVGYNWQDLVSYHGSNISVSEWEQQTAKQREPQRRRELILDGVFDLHLKDWREIIC